MEAVSSPKTLVPIYETAWHHTSEHYCDMTPKSENWNHRSIAEASIATHHLVKHVSMATNTHTTVKELLEEVFSNLFTLKLYKEGQCNPEETS